MSFDSIGYAGSVGWAEWAAIAKNQGVDYLVGDDDDLIVTLADAGAGTVRVGPGTASGQGVTDTMNESEQILTGLTAANTWYTIVLRRDWTPGPGSEVSSLVGVAGGSSRAIAAGRLVGVGATDDQPLALVHRGASALDNVVDLRCWWGNGAVFAATEDALAYLGRDGSVVHVGTVSWEKLPGAVGWTRSVLNMGDANAGVLPISRGGTGGNTRADARDALGITPANINALYLWAWGSPVDGQAKPAAGTVFREQAGSTRVKTNASGDAKITFPSRFPTGLLSFQATLLTGVGISPRPAFFIGYAEWTDGLGKPTKAEFNGRVIKADGTPWTSATFEIAWSAIGW